MEAKTDQGVEFWPLTRRDLARVSTVAQALDNHWVPSQLLERMLDERLSLADVADARRQWCRHEYIRALVNTEQVILNRAFIYNNDAIFDDFLTAGPARDAFAQLLGDRAIVPFLFMEDSPIAPPPFDRDPRVPAAWRNLCQEVSPTCLRLSWDDEENRKIARQGLARRFHEFALTAKVGDADIWHTHLDLADDAARPFRRRLRQVADLADDTFDETGEFLTRARLYERFVIEDGSESHAGRYDANKPFGPQVKQLFDVAYNAYLPDALGAFALTPGDSPRRVVLQEWKRPPGGGDLDATTLVSLLPKLAFDTAAAGLDFDRFGQLELADVARLRQTDEWARYIKSLDALLQRPMGFLDGRDGGIREVFANYALMLQSLTEVAERERIASISKSKPLRIVASIVIDLAGAAISFFFGKPGRIGWKLVGKRVTELAADKSAPFLMRLVLGKRSHEHQPGIDNSIELLRTRVDQAQEQWAALVARVSEAPEFINEDRPGAPVPGEIAQ